MNDEKCGDASIPSGALASVPRGETASVDAAGGGMAGAPGAGNPASSGAPSPGVNAATDAAPAEATAPTQQELAIRSALETVMDPEIGLSVIDLGLIRTVNVGPVRTFIQMLLTTPFCPYAPQMLADVKAAAMSVVEQETEVEILPDAWNPQMMPDPGLLGFSY